MTFYRVLTLYLMAVILTQAVFAAFPQIDLAVTRLFFAEGAGFTWVHGLAPTVNLVIRRLGETVTFLLIALWLYGILTGRFRRYDLRLLAYPPLCVAMASGVVVNLLLKSHVGRARPDTLTEFGGDAAFSPAWQVVNECARNCSFTSGEAALAASLAIPAVVILWPHLTSRRMRVLAVLLAVGYVAVTSLLRIGLGRHFLSDTVFSVLFAAGTALAFYPLLRIDEARRYLPLRRPNRALPETRADQRGVH